MKFQATQIAGAYIIDPEPKPDARGFFARTYCEREFACHGLETRLVQANTVYNARRGTLRGLHYQIVPYEEAKLVRCIQGAVYDVIVDCRAASPTYKKWTAVELTAQNRRMLYVPRGCAHGYQTLADDTELIYHASAFYRPESERGIRYDDPAFKIRWPDVSQHTISKKDAQWPRFRDGQDCSPPLARASQ